MASVPWDIRLARRLVRPLCDTAVTPNQITAVALLAGLGAAALYATGSAAAANLGAVLFVVAALLDHADGELARLAGKSSDFGYYFDHLSGAINYIALFTGIGIGLIAEIGNVAALLGVAAGIAVAGIFALRFAIERRSGRDTFKQPAFAGFEVEDIMYLVAPVTWLGGLVPFLVVVGIGAPLFALWELVWYQHGGVGLRRR